MYEDSDRETVHVTDLDADHVVSQAEELWHYRCNGYDIMPAARKLSEEYGAETGRKPSVPRDLQWKYDDGLPRFSSHVFTVLRDENTQCYDTFAAFFEDIAYEYVRDVQSEISMEAADRTTTLRSETSVDLLYEEVQNRFDEVGMFLNPAVSNNSFAVEDAVFHAVTGAWTLASLHDASPGVDLDVFAAAASVTAGLKEYGDVSWWELRTTFRDDTTPLYHDGLTFQPFPRLIDRFAFRTPRRFK